MTQIKVSILPSDAIKHLKSLKELTRNDFNDILNDSALYIRGHAKKRISQGSRSGKVYYRRKKNSRGAGITHQASKGYSDPKSSEYPKSDTGRLVISINSSTTKFLEKDVGSNLNYAEYLEVGTSRMFARPWLSRAAEESREPIKRMIRNVLSKRGHQS